MGISLQLQRLQRLIQPQNRCGESCFLWGPRQTGKSTLLKQLFPGAPYYDLLKSDEYERLIRRPSLLREELLANVANVANVSQESSPVIIDEVQKIPQLLDEVQWLIVNKNISFVLCGSSARKLKRTGANLLGGRALRYELYPLVSSEIPDFDLMRAINHGLLPRHYIASNAKPLCDAYIGTYLKEEIAAEALTRNIPAFARFLEVAAISNGEMINFTNIARECGVTANAVKEYFHILEDTLVGNFIQSYKARPKRRVIQAPKFYFFDVGIVNALMKRGTIEKGGELFGRAFKHFVMQEIRAHSHYSGINYPLWYWRSTSGLEVDFILGQNDVAIEVKGVAEVQSHHLKGIRAFREEYTTKRNIVISLDVRPRLVDGIEILPIQNFLDELWEGRVM